MTSNVTNPALIVLTLTAVLSTACGANNDGDQYHHPDPGARQTELISMLGQEPDNPEIAAELKLVQQQLDEEFGLIVAVPINGDRTIKFFEPNEGAVAISVAFGGEETGAVDLERGLYGLWYDVAPNRAMPDALERLAEEEQLALATREEAEEEVLEQPAGDTLTPEGEPQLALDDKHQSSSGAHFEDASQGCRTLGHDLENSWCWTNRTGAWGGQGHTSVEAIADTISVYQGVSLLWCNRMGQQNHCQWIDAGEGNYFIGKVGTNWLGVHVNQHLQMSIPLVVTGTNWHSGGSVSGDWSTVHTFGGYPSHLTD
jgi:hypothetical protein